MLGLQVRTHQSDPAKRPDGMVAAGVYVVGGRSEEDQRRLRERAELMIRNALNG